jgi:hypothetical protein
MKTSCMYVVAFLIMIGAASLHTMDTTVTKFITQKKPDELFEHLKNCHKNHTLSKMDKASIQNAGNYLLKAYQDNGRASKTFEFISFCHLAQIDFGMFDVKVKKR